MISSTIHRRSLTKEASLLIYSAFDQGRAEISLAIGSGSTSKNLKNIEMRAGCPFFARSCWLSCGGMAS
jgi:hypothetical protein